MAVVMVIQIRTTHYSVWVTYDVVRHNPLSTSSHLPANVCYYASPRHWPVENCIQRERHPSVVRETFVFTVDLLTLFLVTGGE